MLIHTNQSYRSCKVLAEHREGNVQLTVGNVVLEFKRESNFRVICIYMKSDIIGGEETYKRDTREGSGWKNGGLSFNLRKVDHLRSIERNDGVRQERE